MNQPRTASRLDDKLNGVLLAAAVSTLLAFTVGGAWNDHQAAEQLAKANATPVIATVATASASH